MIYFFVIPLIVLAAVSHATRLPYGIAAGLAVFGAEVALGQYLLYRERRQAAKGGPSWPTATTEPDEGFDAELPVERGRSGDDREAQTTSGEPVAGARRASDRPLPGDCLPYPLGQAFTLDETTGAGARLPGLVGETACLHVVSFSLAATSYRTRGEIEAASAVEPALYRSFFEGMKRVCESHVEVETSPMTTPGELERFLSLHRYIEPVSSPRHCLAARSRDARWAGFVWKEARFRFERARLRGFVLDVIFPAKGGGGYEVTVLFDGERKSGPGPVKTGGAAGQSGTISGFSSGFSLDAPFSQGLSFALAAELMEIGALFGVPVRCRQSMDA